MPPKSKKTKDKPLLKDSTTPAESQINEIDRIVQDNTADLSDSDDEYNKSVFTGMGKADMSIARYTDSPGITPVGTPNTSTLNGSYVPAIIGEDNSSLGIPQVNGVDNSVNRSDGDHDIESQSSLDSLQKRHPSDGDEEPTDSGAADDVNLLSLNYYGLVHNYLAVGFYYASVAGLLYPIFRTVLGLRSYQLKGAGTLQTIWWSFKVAFGCLSDTIPIFGYRRKYYVFAGWFLALLATVGTMLLGQPHVGDAAWPYILTFSAQNLFYIVADVAMDGFVCDLAKHESEEKRGRLQYTAYFVRSIFMAVAALIMSFGFSGKRYGGEFSFSMDLWHYLLILVVVNAIGLPFYLKIADKPNYKRRSYLKQFAAMFDRLKLEGVYRVCIFSFVVHVLAYISNATIYDIESEWCGVEPYIDGLFNNVLASVFMALGIWVTKTFLLNVSWKKTITLSIIAYALLTYIPQILIDTATIRSQYFFGASVLAAQGALGIFFMVCSFAAVEVAEKGYEAITYGLITTISNLSSPFTTILSAQLSGRFDLYDKDNNLRDDAHARQQMLILDSVIFVIQLSSICAVFIIPNQKKELRLLIESGSKSTRVAIALTIGIVACMIWSFAGSLMQIFPKTACLEIVGGKGC